MLFYAIVMRQFSIFLCGISMLFLAVGDTIMSAYRVPSKSDSEMLKTQFKKHVAFVPSLFPKRVIKTRFSIFNKVSFAVSSNLVCIVIIFKIVTLIFPHRLRVCKAIYVEYRVVYRVVVYYILRVL